MSAVEPFKNEANETKLIKTGSYGQRPDSEHPRSRQLLESTHKF